MSIVWFQRTSRKNVLFLNNYFIRPTLCFHVMQAIVYRWCFLFVYDSVFLAQCFNILSKLWLYVRRFRIMKDWCEPQKSLWKTNFEAIVTFTRKCDFNADYSAGPTEYGRSYSGHIWKPCLSLLLVTCCIWHDEIHMFLSMICWIENICCMPELALLPKKCCELIHDVKGVHAIYCSAVTGRLSPAVCALIFIVIAFLLCNPFNRAISGVGGRR